LRHRVPVPLIHPFQLVAAQLGVGGQVYAIERQRHYRLLSPALSRMPSSLVSSSVERTATSTGARPGTSRRITRLGASACAVAGLASLALVCSSCRARWAS